MLCSNKHINNLHLHTKSSSSIMSVGLNTRFLFVNKEIKEFNLTRTDAWWENKQTDSEQKKIFELETKNKSPRCSKGGGPESRGTLLWTLTGSPGLSCCACSQFTIAYRKFEVLHFQNNVVSFIFNLFNLDYNNTNTVKKRQIWKWTTRKYIT